MTIRRWFLLAALAAFVSASCSGGDGAAASGGGDAVVPAVNATEAALLPTNAAALPELDLGGFRALLDQLRGTPVLVNFWGSWCGPCRQEAATLASFHDRYGGRVQFIGVDLLDSRASARGFMREFGWTYPSVFDPPGAIRDGLGLLGQPVTLFYDADGELVDRWIGPIPADELRSRLQRIVAA